MQDTGVKTVWTMGIVDGAFIIDYRDIEREIVLKNEKLYYGNEIEYKKIYSISELEEYVSDLMTSVLCALSYCTQEDLKGVIALLSEKPSLAAGDVINEEWQITEKERELLISEIIFDILSSAYISKECENKIGIDDFGKNMSKELDTEDELGPDVANITKFVSRKIRAIRSETPLLGSEGFARLMIEPMEYNISSNTFKKRDLRDKYRLKDEWAFFYYHRIKLLGKIEKHSLDIKKKKMPYQSIIKDIYDYNSFLNKILPKDDDKAEEYFNKTMKYHFLESDHLIDTIFSFSNVMVSLGENQIQDYQFMIKSPIFPSVCHESNHGEVNYTHSLYIGSRLFMIENDIHKKILERSELNHLKIHTDFIKYHIICAKTACLFKYYAEYILRDYNEAAEFLKEKYNLSDYHNQNKIWKDIELYKKECEKIKKENEKKKSVLPDKKLRN